MSEDRKLSPLAPRTRLKGAASILDASARATATPDPTPLQEDTVAVPANKNVAPRKPRAAAPADQPPRAAHVQIATRMPEEARARAHAAFRHAQFHEDVASFTEFVNNAIDAEARRIELAYNEGKRFEVESSNLSAGRPKGR